MNDKLFHWLKKPNNLSGITHISLVFIAAVAVSSLGHWSLWLVLLLAGFNLAFPLLRRWLEDEQSERVALILPAVLAAGWGVVFSTILADNWPVILFVTAALMLLYLALFRDYVFILTVCLGSLASIMTLVLAIHSYYLSAFGAALLFGVFLWHVHQSAENEPEPEPLPEPVVTEPPPVIPSPEQEEKINSLKNRIRTLEADLSSAEMTKMEFLATMSHEIRTPLNGIIPLLDILLDSELSDFQKDYLQTAFVSAKQMQKLIDDLLDYSKVEAGKLTIENVGLKLPRVLESVVEALKPSAEKKGLSISLEVSPFVSPLLRGDPLRVRQVVTNLLSNAIKFSDRGIIKVQLEKRKDLGDKELVRISVTDQGIGMGPEQQAILFQPFTQADGSSTRKFGGTGIGLAISKKIVELMGGEINVESAKGKGSRFFVDLPLRKPINQTPGDLRADQTEAFSPKVNTQGFILNTSFSMTQSVQNQLRPLGIRCKLTSSLPALQESLSATRQLNRKVTLFWIFVDFDTAPKQARALMAELLEPHAEKDTHLCVFTTQQHIAGVPKHNHIHIIGPQDSAADILQAVIQQESKQSPASREAAASLSDQPVFSGLNLDENPPSRTMSDAPSPSLVATDDSPPAGKAGARRPPSPDNMDERVLLVEDNQVNLKVAQKLIQYIGYPFDVANNGLEALEKVKQHRYRMILMDCQMPVMDGYLATRRIREYETAADLNKTPIIAMTANAMMGDREKCLAAGMDDYMSKPLNRYVLEKTLKKWDPLKQQPDTHAPPLTKEPDAANINDKWLSIKTLREIREFMGDDVERLLSLFKQDAPGTLRHMRQALHNKDFKEVRKHAHSLKSASANIGARGLSYFCKRMEAEALSGDIPRLHSLMENIKKSYLLTVREIDKYAPGKKQA